MRELAGPRYMGCFVWLGAYGAEGEGNSTTLEAREDE